MTTLFSMTYFVSISVLSLLFIFLVSLAPDNSNWEMLKVHGSIPAARFLHSAVVSNNKVLYFGVIFA